MVRGKGTSKPYVSFVGNSTTDVTGSMHLVRFKNYAILLDCGLIQDADILSNYNANKAQLKAIKPKEIDWIILSHIHIDHSGLIPALFALGCHAHVYVPKGSLPFLRLLWADSMKIMQSDCIKIQNKHNVNAAPFYTQADIDKTLIRCEEIGYEQPYQCTKDVLFTMYNAGHIIHSAQILLELKQGSIVKRIGYTGDIGGSRDKMWSGRRDVLPYCNLLIGENTYNSPSRPNNIKDRTNDVLKIRSIVGEYNKILIPAFSLQRTQEILWLLDDMGITMQMPVYLDSPLAIKICDIWDSDNDDWRAVMSRVKIINFWEQSVGLQNSNEHCIIIAASGFLQGGRIMAHIKTALSNANNHIIFIGYAGENNIASQIKDGQKEVCVDGELIANKANITELRSFSSHASYEELIEYYCECRFDKLAFVHGRQEDKVAFCDKIQDNLCRQNKTSRVICTNKQQKIYL